MTSHAPPQPICGKPLPAPFSSCKPWQRHLQAYFGSHLRKLSAFDLKPFNQVCLTHSLNLLQGFVIKWRLSAECGELSYKSCTVGVFLLNGFPLKVQLV